ncbi:hypothetical protein BGZ94_008100 [Podila epigama]|nr:hypothetical protein BGZ94_008100 [Podila epigama]
MPLQQFRSNNGWVLDTNVPVVVDENTLDYYVMWEDIQLAFPNISHLLDDSGHRVLYSVDSISAVLETPLRVNYFPVPYTVILRPSPETGSASHPSIDQKLHNIRTDFSECRSLHLHLQASASWKRELFAKIAVTCEYLRQRLQSDLNELEISRAVFSSSEKIQCEYIQENIAAFAQWAQNSDRQNKLQNPIDFATQRLEFVQPRLFLVLPRHARESAVPLFRLHFLCEIKDMWSMSRHPKHIHLPDHPGYDIVRHDEFFRIYGHYALSMLELVKYGFSGSYTFVPKLSTFEILGNTDGMYHGYGLTLDNIEYLVDQAIQYLQGYTQGLIRPEIWPTAAETHGIGKFLDVPQGDSGTSGLNCTILDLNDTRWLCHGHSFVGDNDLSYFYLFVYSHGGMVDIHQSLVTVNVASLLKVQEFSGHLKRTGCMFDVTLCLGWHASMSELEKIVQIISSCGIKILYIDGVSLMAHPQPSLHWNQDAFLMHVINSAIHLLIFRHYPRPSEHYVYLGRSATNAHGITQRVTVATAVHALILKATANIRQIPWLPLRRGLDQYREGIDALYGTKDPTGHLTNLTKELVRLEVLDITGIDLFYNGMWFGRIEVTDGIACGLSETKFPNPLFTERSIPGNALNRLIYRPNDLQDALQLYNLVDGYHSLKQIELLVHETEAFNDIVTELYRRWMGPNRLQLVLCEKGVDENNVRNIATFVTWNEQMLHKAIICLWWSSDHVVSRACNATLLEAAMRQFPGTLTSFSLDISSLTDRALFRIKSVLQQVRLEKLHIKCVPFQGSLHVPVLQMLRAIQWPTIKSLVLSGEKIDCWIQVWTSDRRGLIPLDETGPCQLLSFQVHGAGSPVPQMLSHQSALWIHELVYSAEMLTELCLENVRTVEAMDWQMIWSAFNMENEEVASSLEAIFSKMNIHVRDAQGCLQTGIHSNITQ